MNTNRFDISTKELVNTYSYTTITNDRYCVTDVMIDGRKYFKTGTLQAITVVGNVYKDINNNKVMFVGIAKQNPNDSKCDKNLAYEVANLKALECPDMIIRNVPSNISNLNFQNMMAWYVDMMDLQFIKTRQEIENAGKNPKAYDR